MSNSAASLFIITRVPKMKIVSWNINRASYVRKNFWKYFEKLNFDIGMFQEVYMIPYKIRKRYEVVRGEMNVILIKNNINAEIKRTNVLDTHSKNEVIADFCTSCEIELFGKTITLISIYNYIGPNKRDFSEFLQVLWKYISINRNKIIIIGGDFNMDEEFQGQLRGWGQLMKNLKEELSTFGYKDVLSDGLNSKPYTFITPANKRPYQLDYLFIPRNIKLVNAKVGNEDEIFNTKPRLSDHLPIIATVEIRENRIKQQKQ